MINFPFILLKFSFRLYQHKKRVHKRSGLVSRSVSLRTGWNRRKFEVDGVEICKFIRGFRVERGRFRVSWTRGGFLGVCRKKAIATDIRWVEVGSGEGSWPVVEWGMGRVSRLEGRLLISQVRTSPRVQEGPNPIPYALVTGHNHPSGRTPRHWTQRLPPRPLLPPSFIPPS